MKTFHSYLGILAVTLLLSALSASADDKTEFHAYVRSNFQTGQGGNPGVRIDNPGGFAPHGRLQEGQYFELTAKANLVEHSYFQFTLARGGNSFHYTGVWPDDGFTVRDLYYQVDQFPDAPKFSLWFGSRMYRGSDIHLFDNWFLDNQNLLGGGLAYTGDLPMEFAIGTRKDTSYAIAASSDTFIAPNTQRYLLINKMTLPWIGSNKIKTNIEYHYVPAGLAAATISNVTGPVNVPAQSGLMAGLQIPVWDGASLFVNSGFGDVTGGIDTPRATAIDNPAFTSRDGAKAAQVALGGSNDLGSQLGVMYGSVAKWLSPKDTDSGASISLAVRPLYYWSDHLHVGFEADWITYPKAMTTNDVNYIEISPMLEYKMNKGLWGVPKFKLIASNAFYSKDVSNYGYPSKYAFNLVSGIELWF